MVFAAYVPSPADFIQAPLYRKTARLKESDIEVAQGDTIVDTLIRGFCETTNTAHKGDVIITGPAGERYVLTAEKFNRLYEHAPDGVCDYCCKVMRRCIVIDRNVALQTEWGETQYMRVGDIIVQDGAFYYGIERSVFDQTYSCVN